MRDCAESGCFVPKGQLDFEAHGGRTIAGVCARVTQRILAHTAAIWHNDDLGLSIRRSLIAASNPMLRPELVVEDPDPPLDERCLEKHLERVL